MCHYPKNAIIVAILVEVMRRSKAASKISNENAEKFGGVEKLFPPIKEILGCVCMSILLTALK